MVQPFSFHVTALRKPSTQACWRHLCPLHNKLVFFADHVKIRFKYTFTLGLKCCSSFSRRPNKNIALFCSENHQQHHHRRVFSHLCLLKQQSLTPMLLLALSISGDISNALKLRALNLVSPLNLKMLAFPEWERLYVFKASLPNESRQKIKA